MTYSVIARDERTGELGVACQSHFFGVGSAVNWAEAGVGVVATQSLVEPAYGWRGLELMRGGVPAPEALKIILADDPYPERRQVAMLDAAGELAVHTGEWCIGVRGSRDGGWFSVQGNMLTAEHVLDAMAAAMADGDDPLAERLVAALRAAEDAGGELRGSQAAGIRVVTGAAAELPWGGTVLDLRVEDATDPVAELARLVGQQRLAGPVVEVLFTEGLIFGSAAGVAPGPAQPAVTRLADVARQDGEVGIEAEFWLSVVLARTGNATAAEQARQRAVARRPSLAHLAQNLTAAGVLPEKGATS